MTTGSIAALVFALATLVVIGFQVALAACAPWASYAMGGQRTGRYPPAMRAAALVQAVLLAVLAVVVAVFAGAAFASTAEAKIKRCNGQKVLCDQPFNEVVLAGAHNAMSTASLGWVLPNQSIAIPDQPNAIEIGTGPLPGATAQRPAAPGPRR